MRRIRTIDLGLPALDQHTPVSFAPAWRFSAVVRPMDYGSLTTPAAQFRHRSPMRSPEHVCLHSRFVLPDGARPENKPCRIVNARMQIARGCFCLLAALHGMPEKRRHKPGGSQAQPRKRNQGHSSIVDSVVRPRGPEELGDQGRLRRGTLRTRRQRLRGLRFLQNLPYAHVRLTSFYESKTQMDGPSVTPRNQ